MEKKINQLLEQFIDVEKQLSDPAILSDQKTFKELSQKHSYLLELKETWEAFQKAEFSLKENQELIKSEEDAELIDMLKEDIQSLEVEVPKLRSQVEALLVPPDPNDNANVILEIRAGTGGDEAALFVGDCARMYRFYAEKMKWKFEIITSSPSDVGGFREFIVGISGKNVHRLMQYESGTHRVQRIPTTETQGRVHTSAVTVAIMMEPPEKTKVHIDEKDLKIDTYRASGAGGQHVNTTDSAVRVTHIPTGAVAYCSQERSQHKNKDTAMRLLQAKILEAKIRKEQEERAEKRSSQIGSGDRSEKIRTYNYPQNRVTDHRIGLTLYKLDQVMQGDLDQFTQGLVNYFYQAKLSG